MAIIRAHEFISLDGVFESPSWTMEFGFDAAMGETLAAITGASDAILLGRNTHEMFAPAWRERTAEDDPGAPFFNDTEKFVVGARKPSEEWANTTRVGAYDAAQLREFKESRQGDIYISGSGRLVRGLIEDGLLDSDDEVRGPGLPRLRQRSGAPLSDSADHHGGGDQTRVAARPGLNLG